MSEFQLRDSRWEVAPDEQATIIGLNQKIRIATLRSPDIRLIEEGDLKDRVSPAEWDVVQRTYAVNPAAYNVKIDFEGIYPVPEDIVRIPPVARRYNGKTSSTIAQFMPPEVYDAYLAMSGAIANSIGEPLIVTASYRSPTYQALRFLQALERNEFNVGLTVAGTSLPGYSQHGLPHNLALDFATFEGQPSGTHPRAYTWTDQYGWLTRRAARFGFHKSLQTDRDGLKQPWHWQYDPSKPRRP